MEMDMDQRYVELLGPDKAKLRKQLLRTVRSEFIIGALRKEGVSEAVVASAREWKENLRTFLELVEKLEERDKELATLRQDLATLRKMYDELVNAGEEAHKAIGAARKFNDEDFFGDYEDSSRE